MGLRAFILISGLIFCFHQRALACASCGSGGDDPLILYPWETWKIYVGFSKMEDISGIDAEGRQSKFFGPTSRETTTLAVGYSLSARSFITLSSPYVVNRRKQDQRGGWGDQVATARYTLLQQDMSVDYIPQVQLLAGVKTGYAKSVYDYNDLAQLDVVGTGFPEAKLGVDIWHGMFAWKGGVAQTVVMPLGGRSTPQGRVRPGISYRSTATFGYGWGDMAKIIVGVYRDQSTEKEVNGKLQQDSDTLNHSWFVTGDAAIQQKLITRLTWSKSAALFANRNTSQSDMFTLAVMRAF